jgi:transposase, IS5 family
MLPKAPQTAQGDLFKSDIIAIIDSNHPLVRLADKIDWHQFEKSLHPTYVPGKGAPAINTRLMVALHIPKFQHNLSNQAVVDRWAENLYWHFLSGMRFFSHQPPVDSSSMTRWRARLGESGSEEIPKASLLIALKVGGAARGSDFQDVNVDTTVQTRDIRYPTDSCLYHRVPERLVKTARKEGFVIKQSYVRVGKRDDAWSLRACASIVGVNPFL